MTEWKNEICGADMPQELELVSQDTYIQRRDIRYVTVESEDEMISLPSHWECTSRFITVAEYNNLQAIESIRVDEAIDDYTLQLIREGML